MKQNFIRMAIAGCLLVGIVSTGHHHDHHSVWFAVTFAIAMMYCAIPQNKSKPQM